MFFLKIRNFLIFIPSMDSRGFSNYRIVMKTSFNRSACADRTKMKIKNNELQRYLLIYKAAAPYPPTAILSAK